MHKTFSYAHTASLCLLLLGCGSIAACALNGAGRQDEVDSTREGASGPMQTEQDSIFAYLATIDQQAFQSAFLGLDEASFTGYNRTEQFDEDDFLVAFDEKIVRHSGPPSQRTYEVRARDSAGVFAYGYLSRFVPERLDSRDPMDMSRRIVPADPAYLTARNRDSFEYTSLPDTLMGDVSARVIEIQARPEIGDGQSVRRVRLSVDRASNRLIAVYIERRDLAMWYREESLFYVHIRQVDDESWMPYNTRFETRVVIPFRPIHRFRTVSTYFDYGRDR